MFSASLLVLAMFALRYSGLEGYARIDPSFIVGVLVCGMLVGEVRDLWMRRLERLQMANEYRQYRLDEFTRAHQILRVSHDLLEQRVAGSDQSLRSSLLGLREKLRVMPDARRCADRAGRPDHGDAWAIRRITCCGFVPC